MSFFVQKPRFIFLSRTLYLVYIWVHTDPCHYPSRLDLLSKGLMFVIFLIVAAPESLKKKNPLEGYVHLLFCCSCWEMTHSFYLQRVSRARWKWAPNRKSDYSFQISVNAFIFLFYRYPPDKQFCGWIVYILQTVPAVCYLQLCSLWSLVLPCCYSLAGRWNHCQENGNQQKNASP